MAPDWVLSKNRAGKLHFICPLCRYPQRTNTIRSIGLRHHAQMALLTIVVLALAFPVFGWKALMFYLVFWAAFEFFYRLRKRQALVCESCGFDPFLYRQNVHLARKELRRHWEARIEKENLFAGIKLRNYQTGRVKEASPAADAPAAEAPKLGGDAPGAAPAPAKSP